MKQLKSTAEDLRELFTHTITLRHICEPLASFDATTPYAVAYDFARPKRFDLVGVRKEGLVAGYAETTKPAEGSLDKHCKDIETDRKLPDTASILEAMEVLRGSPAVFVSIVGRVQGIVTRGDLQKAPVRMWLFGLVSLVEMQLLRLIRAQHPNGEWQSMISDGRLQAAQKILEERRTRNADTDLADCLEFCDKADIIGKTEGLTSKLGFSSKGKYEKSLEALKQLRDDLAHGQDILAGRWPDLIDLAKRADDILQQAEALG